MDASFRLPAFALLVWLTACGRSDDEGRLGELDLDLAPALETLDSMIPGALPPDVDRATLARGREVYPVCAVCHGPDAEGTQLGPPLRGAAPRMHTDGSREEIAGLIRSGVVHPIDYPVPMPAMAELFEEEELNALAAYVQVLGNAVD